MIKLLLLFLAVAGMVSTVSATDYSIGADEGGWAIKGQMTPNGDGSYSYIINLPANYDMYLFTIFEGTEINSDWSNAYRPKGAGDNWGLDANNTPTMEKGANDHVLYYPVSSTIARAIKVDFTPSSGACTVTRLIALASGYNHWSTETDYLTETSRGSNIYEGSATLEVNTEGYDDGYQFVGINSKGLKYYSKKVDNGWWLDVNQANATVYVDGVFKLTADFSNYNWNDPELIQVKISTGSYGKATFSLGKAIDLTGINEISAYIITAADKTTGILTKEQQTGEVPESTGLYIEGAVNASVYVPVIADKNTEISGNMLRPATGKIDVLSQTMSNGTITNYILTVNTVNGDVNTPKFYKVNASNNTVPANKAYLQIPTANAARESFWFSDATAINAVEAEQDIDGQAYNLAGQRIAQPTKGLYIVNGKKIIKK